VGYRGKCTKYPAFTPQISLEVATNLMVFCKIIAPNLTN